MYSIVFGSRCVDLDEEAIVDDAKSAASTRSSSAPDSPGCMRCIGCASWAVRVRGAGEGRQRRRHMAVQPLSRARAATSRASSTPTASPTRSSRSGCGPRPCRPSPRSRPTSTSSPTGSTCAATSAFDTEVVAMTFDEDAAEWVVADCRRGSPSSPRSWSRRPASCRYRWNPTSPGWTPSPARRCTPAAGRRRASTSPASGSASSAPVRPACN